MKGIIYCIGSFKIGLGHITRSIILADEFKKQNIYITFITNINQIVSSKLKKTGYNHYSIRSENYLEKKLKRLKFDFILLDSNEIKRDIVLNLKKEYLLFNIAVQGDAKWYSHYSFLHSLYLDSKKPNDSDYTFIKKGPKYVPLDKCFKQKKEKKIKEKKLTCIISMGGGDAMNFTCYVIKILKSMNINIYIKIILGKANKNIKKILCELKDVSFKYEVIYDTKTMKKELKNADFGILAMGTTFYEACAVGLPSINLCPSLFHEKLANIYHKKGMLINSGMITNKTSKKLKDNIELLIKNKNIRQKLSKNGIQEVDGLGCFRIVNSIKTIVTNKKD